MKVVDNRNTRMDNKKNQTKNIIFDQNSMSVIKKSTISNSHQIQTKTKQFNLYLIGKDMEPVPNETGWLSVRKKANRCEVQKCFHF